MEDIEISMHRADIVLHRPLLNWCGSDDDCQRQRVHSYNRPAAQDLNASDDEDSVTNAAAGELSNIHLCSPHAIVSAAGTPSKSKKFQNVQNRANSANQHQYESVKSRSSMSYQHAPIPNAHRNSDISSMPHIEEEAGSLFNRHRLNTVDAASTSDVRGTAISRRMGQQFHHSQGSASWSATHGSSIPLITVDTTIEDGAEDEEKRTEIEIECAAPSTPGRPGYGVKSKRSVAVDDIAEEEECGDGEFKASHKRMSSSEIRLQNWQMYSEEVLQSNECSPKHC